MSYMQCTLIIRPILLYVLDSYNFSLLPMISRDTFNVGAVANLRRIKSAISVARKVLVHTEHSVRLQIFQGERCFFKKM